MKKVKLNLVALFVFALLIASCDQEGLYDYNDFNDDGWGQEGGNEDNDNGGDYEDGNEGDDNGGGNGNGGEEGENGDLARLTSYRIDGENISKIKDFDIEPSLESYQQDIGTHQKMWDYYKSLIPANQRTYITEFMVFHGKGDIAGYVEPIDQNNLSKWRMGLAIDATGDLNNRDIKEEFAYVAIHEFAHVLTLNSSQIAVGGSPESCPNFHTGEGCSNSDSYINAFFELGWADIYDEFQNTQDPYEFYQKYNDRFVTDYAASNPGEDIAEVFSVFITQDQVPSGSSIADKKVQLMYDYPELVSLRNEIRSDPVLRAIQPGSWVKQGRKSFLHKGHHH